MEPLVALSVAREEFDRRLRAVTAGDWDRSTPCEDWTVRDLVVHVIFGARMTVALLEGATQEEALAVVADATLPADPVAAYADATDAQANAFAAPGAFDRILHHPAGDFPGVVVLNFRIGDHTMHAWDLARAIGADETLNADLVAQVWEGIQPMIPVMGATGRFGTGPSGSVPDDAPLQLRLLDASGRRP
jgi:uncharacterized protein (TIGR03086 family)